VDTSQTGHAANRLISDFGFRISNFPIPEVGISGA
jgi:hypothetical protein